MTIWDEIANLFKSKDQLKEEKEAEYKDAKEKEKLLLKELGKLETEYNNSLPKPVEKDYSNMFEKFDKTEKVDNTLSDDKLRDIAKKEATKDYDEVITKIKNQFEKNKKTANVKKDEAKDNYINQLKNLQHNKELTNEKINNDMTKNNLYYSSIKDNLLKQNDDVFAKNVSNAKENTYQYISELDNSIKELEKNRDENIENYDKKTIENYDKLLGNLIDKRNIEKQKIVDYNKKVNEDKIKYDNSVKKAIEQLKANDLKQQREDKKLLEEQEYKYGYTGDKKVNYTKRLDLAREFYSTLPKDVALRAVKNNHDLKGYLGVYYYDLVGEISAREERKSIFS